jgi:hypothetical protein
MFIKNDIVFGKMIFVTNFCLTKRVGKWKKALLLCHVLHLHRQAQEQLKKA